MDINTMTKEQLKAALKALQSAEKQQKRAGNLGDGLHAKVSAKGGVSVYGLGRFPFSGYYSQWKRILGAAAALDAFLEAHKDELAHKTTAADVMTETPSAEPATV